MKKIISVICVFAMLLSSALSVNAGYEIREEMAASYGNARYISDASALQQYCDNTGFADFKYGYVVTYQGGFGGGGADASISVDDANGFDKIVFDARVIDDDFCSVNQLNYAMYPEFDFEDEGLTYPQESTGIVRISPHWDDEYSPDVLYPEVTLSKSWHHYEMDISSFDRFRLYMDAFGATQGANELCAVVVANVELVSSDSSVAVTPDNSASDNYYTATEPSEWAAAEVAKAKEYGIITEDFPIVINYQAPIKREAFAQLIVNCVTSLKGTTAQEEYEQFCTSGKCVKFDDSKLLQVMVAASMGIVNGVGDGKFAPFNNINRQEIAVMMYRAIKYMEEINGVSYVKEIGSLANFTDASSVAEWAILAVGSLAFSGIMNGTSDTTLSPLDTTTGEQAIALTVRIFELMKK